MTRPDPEDVAAPATRDIGAELDALLAEPDPPDSIDWIADLESLEREHVRRRCTASLYDFFVAGWHVLEATTPLQEGRHLRVLCDHVQAAIEDWAARQRDHGHVQRIRNLVATLPPGTLKSRVLVFAVPWAWVRWPELRVIALSCNPRVATRDSTYTRDVIASDWYRQTFGPRWEIRRDTDGKHAFANTAGGFRLAHGLDARIIGQRADVLLVDDPHDPEEALSDAVREGVIERWQTSASNRVNDLGSSVRIMIAQRTHEADLPAAVIAEGWTHVNLPLLFEPENAGESPLGRYDWRVGEGECLHPERFTPRVIEAERARLGEARFSALYQQRPTPAGGAMVKAKWLRFWRQAGEADASGARPSGCWRGPARVLPDSFDATVIAADLAGGKETREGDFNVVVAISKSGSSFFVREVWRERAGAPEVQRTLVDFAHRYPSAGVYVEQAAAGAAVVAGLQSQIPGVVGVPPRGSKVQRLAAVLRFFEAGNVHLRDGWTWLDGAVAELTTFPKARFDDFVDAVSLALVHLEFSFDPRAAAEEAERRARMVRMVLMGMRDEECARCYVAGKLPELGQLRDSDFPAFGLPACACEAPATDPERAEHERQEFIDEVASGLGFRFGVPPHLRR